MIMCMKKILPLLALLLISLNAMAGSFPDITLPDLKAAIAAKKKAAAEAKKKAAEKKAEAARLATDAGMIAAASLLKDVTPFPAGSGPNSNDRMPEWLASDRTVIAGTPRATALLMLKNYGWDINQWKYLDRMWWHESGWNPGSVDKSQGPNFDPNLTWGIPQAFPAYKMGNVAYGGGPDWKTNPTTQIRWGLTYIQRAYGSPQAAWAAWVARAATGRSGWY